MKRSCLLLLLIGIFISGSGFAKCDTNAINKVNDRILNLCYEKPEQALKDCEKVIMRSQKCKYIPGEVRALIRIGICYDVLSKSELSIASYEKALAVSEKHGYLKGIASCENNLGLIYWRKNNLKRAIQSFHKAKLFFDALLASC